MSGTSPLPGIRFCTPPKKKLAHPLLGLEAPLQPNQGPSCGPSLIKDPASDSNDDDDPVDPPSASDENDDSDFVADDPFDRYCDVRLSDVDVFVSCMSS